VSHCTDEQLNIQGAISYSCDGSTFDYPITDGQVCFRDGALSHCNDKDVFICLEDNNGYFEICEINECEVVVYGTLDNNPSINGQPIGFYNGINSSASVTCQGPVVNALNTQQSPMTLLGCSRDHFFLENLGVPFSVPFGTGECLNVKLFDQDGNLINDHVPGFGTFFGGFDITRTFIDVEPGLYQIVFELVCCNREETNCGPNDSKTAWIDFQGELSYEIIGSTGFFPNTTSFSPSDEPYGTIYSDVSGDFFAISLYNIQNTSNSDIEVNLNSTFCDDDDNNDISSGTQIYPPTSNFISVPFASFSQEPCVCYRLDVTYDDGCEEGQVTDSFFFQSGPDCVNDFGELDDPIFKRAIQLKPHQDIRLAENPVENQVRFIIGDNHIEKAYSLRIIDVQGRVINDATGVFSGNSLTVHLNKVSGTYFSSIQVGGEMYSGKIIKI
jgi:hypothetical protein